ncbi:MAG: DAK2 domain-containing protein [Clostridia bacterium]|nr:DAK2 domain-containing protein [Clostridia bacterium]
MNTQKIDGKCYAEMLRGGTALLLRHSQEINDLNVFPVPDGDTGTNMARTMDGGLSELSSDIDSIGKVSSDFTHGVLLGARGNSGVILSQIFAGINEELSHYDEVGARELVDAYKKGIAKSYSAVQQPTEGTILTVFRESIEYAEKNITDESSVEDFFRMHIESAKDSLARTKEILPALAEADVVDSGGAGYLYIIMGMYAVLTGELTGSIYKSPETQTSKVNIDLFTRDSRLEFGYCTEFMLRLTTEKCDPDSFEIGELITLLESLGGESIVAYKLDDVVKVHVHTFAPGNVLTVAQSYGEFLTVKIENMSLGHTEEPKPKKAKKPFSVIAVAQGEGLSALFSEMGADEIVTGGQTLNPSTEEIIAAFDRAESDDIIVLPNNKNVILAAKQAAELYDKARVHIIPTKNMMQGYGALSVVTPGITDVSSLVESVTRAAEGVIGAEVTMAVRDVTLGGREIKKGDYIAIASSEITAVAGSAESAVLEHLDSVDMDDYEIITLFVGSNVSDIRRVKLTEIIEEKYDMCELEVFESGNEVYDYMIAIE